MKHLTELNSTFNHFIMNCSSQDLAWILSNELSDDEMMVILMDRSDEVKEEILDNFNIKY